MNAYMLQDQQYFQLQGFSAFRAHCAVDSFSVQPLPRVLHGSRTGKGSPQLRGRDGILGETLDPASLETDRSPAALSAGGGQICGSGRAR